MEIITLAVGALGTNCYLAYDSAKNAVVIDPGDDAGRILDRIQTLSLQLRYILLTHGHFDHILAAEEIRRATGAAVIAGAKEAPLLSQTRNNLSVYHGAPVMLSCDRTVSQGDVIQCGEMELAVFETPGHTPGGVCYYAAADGVLFSGDTLFCESIGRTDFPGGSFAELISSIREKLLVLPEDTRVLPGHEEESTIGHEKKANPFVV